MAVFSNGNVKNQGAKIEALELYRWFEPDHIFISEVTGYHKPSLGAFEYVQEKPGTEDREEPP